MEVLYLSLYYPVWENQRITKQLTQLCFIFQYSGKWNFLQKLLEEASTPEEFERIYIDEYGARDFFGNFLGKTERRFLIRRFDKHTDQGKERRYITKKVYRRGYDDKGTLRPTHKPKLPGGEKIEKIDKRDKVQHPLVGEKIRPGRI
jgi:hypothetical protein